MVNAHEAGAPLTTEGVRAYSTTHVRCGSSFLFIVLVIAILVFALVGLQSVWIMVLSRILLVPVIAAIGYEAVYFGARHTGNPVVRVLLKPGLLMQALSTRRPDDDQLEVALVAVNGAIEADRAEVEAVVVAADAADVADDGEVLMLGYMNEEAIQRTLAGEDVWFYSRSRQEMWHKGATSGDYIKVVSVWKNCEDNTLLVKARPVGPVCHTNNRSCFYRELPRNS